MGLTMLHLGFSAEFESDYWSSLKAIGIDMTYVVGPAILLNRQTSGKAKRHNLFHNDINAVILGCDWDSDPTCVIERNN